MSDSEDSTVTHTEAPPSPDYVSGPEDPEQVPPLPEFVPELVYPEFMPLEDEILPAEKQPLPAADLPAVDSSRYILESDPEEDLADYPIDKDDDDDDDEEESSEDEEEDEDEEEEVHPASDDSILPPPVHHTIARISIPVQAPTPVWSEAEIGRLLAIPSPPPSPLSLWSSPLYQIPSPPLPAESRDTIYFPFTTIEYTTIRYATTSIDTFTYIITTFALPSTSHREDVPEVTLPPRKRLRIALGPRFEVGESSSAPTARPTGGFRADYGFVATLKHDISRDPERETITDEIYGRLDDAQDDRVLMSGQLNMLRRDRHDHARTARLMETEIRISRQACVQSMDASDTARAEKMAPKRTTRSTPATTTTTTTTSVTNAQLKALIDQGVADALAACDADRNQNGKDNHDSGMSTRRQAHPARECTYQDFMKYKPLYFKGTEGFVELTQ
nr:hypothetical protein [Tanacetum cinerariifolium]